MINKLAESKVNGIKYLGQEGRRAHIQMERQAGRTMGRQMKRD